MDNGQITQIFFQIPKHLLLLFFLLNAEFVPARHQEKKCFSAAENPFCAPTAVGVNTKIVGSLLYIFMATEKRHNIVLNKII